MKKRVRAENLEEYFVNIDNRVNKGVFFYRFVTCDDITEWFLVKYYEGARESGGVVEGGIQNPTKENISYFREIIGEPKLIDEKTISEDLRKWMPRISTAQRADISEAIWGVLEDLQRSGKNESIIRNTYIKFMCWLYYRFERIVSNSASKYVPKLLCEGNITSSELYILTILSAVGCDIVLLLPEGGELYKRIDPQSRFSDEWKVDEGKCFSDVYGIEEIRRKGTLLLNDAKKDDDHLDLACCTNSWFDGAATLDKVTIPLCERGGSSFNTRNCFIRIKGVEDRLTYQNDLYRMYKDLKDQGRSVVVVDGVIPAAVTDEISIVKRRNTYKNKYDLISDLKKNIYLPNDSKLQTTLSRAFVEIMLEIEAEKSIGQLMNVGVNLICWIWRYGQILFKASEFKEPSCFVHFGACKNEKEALFLRMLSGTPVDVLVLVPNLDEECLLDDKRLIETKYNESLFIDKFPQDSSDLKVGTSAYYAEKDLDTLLYQDSGIYRDKQYSRADSIVLRTMYEEISILWSEEVKYRPGFEVIDKTVNVPVIFSKISGVKDGDVDKYWNDIKNLIIDDVFYVNHVPYFRSYNLNPIREYAPGFIKDGRILRSKICNHPKYPYGYLRGETQELILDKIQLLLDRNLIEGISENGAEYVVMSTLLSLEKNILRSIQNFDFTKKNPKLIYLNVGEQSASIEDTIVMVFLSLIGFDILMFVPTGYRTVERYIKNISIEEHQIGTYMYDLHIPDLQKKIAVPKRGWKRKLFGGK